MMPDNRTVTDKLTAARRWIGNLEAEPWNNGVTDYRVLNTFAMLIEAIEILQAEVRARDEEIGRLTRLHQDHDGRLWKEHR